MSESPKISELKSSILSSINSSLNWILELCESEIEKQFLLIIMNIVIKDKFSPRLFVGSSGEAGEYLDWQISDFDFLYEEVEAIFLDSNTINSYLSQGYKNFGIDLIRPKAIRFKDECYMLADGREFTYYELTPQFEVSYKNNYRPIFIDFS